MTMKDGRRKSIEEIKVGEEVLTYDEINHRQTASPVEEVFHHKAKKSILYTFTYGNQTSTSNDVHPFYLPKENKYESAENIYLRWKNKELIYLLSENTSEEIITIKNIERSEKNIPLYNLHVTSIYDKRGVDKETNLVGYDGHNYYANGVLVHNFKWGGCSDSCTDKCEAMLACEDGCDLTLANVSSLKCSTYDLYHKAKACVASQPRYCSGSWVLTN